MTPWFPRAAAAAALALSGLAHAGLVTYTYTGTVSDDSAARGYTSFAGSFSFDSATADGIADPSTAAYAHSGSPWGISIAFDGGATISYSSSFNVLVSNNLASFDQFAVLGQDGADSLSLSLTDFTALLFASDALPTAALGLGDFGWTSMSWEAGGETLTGQLTGLDCTGGCAGTGGGGGGGGGTGGGGGGGGTGGGGSVPTTPQTLPLPGGLSLASLALGMAAFVSRRSLRDAQRAPAALAG